MGKKLTDSINNIFHKLRLDSLLFRVFCIFLSVILFFTGLSVYLISIVSDTQETEDTRKIVRRAGIAEGNIETADGVVIMKTLDPEISKIGTVETPAVYSPVLGYNSLRYSVDTNAVRGILSDYLYYIDDSETGATVTLTLFDSLQQYCYSLLNSDAATQGYDSAVVVIDNQTAALRALVSVKGEYPEYDVNEIDNIYEDVCEIKEFFYPEYLLRSTPGSTFKIISSVPIIENGLQDEIYNDTTGVLTKQGIDGEIINYNSYSYGKLNLKEALIHSANVYFADMYTSKLPGSSLTSTAESFLFNSDIDLDAIKLQRSVFDLNSAGGNIIDLTARTSIGQGHTEVTPIHAAMILSAIINDGVMKKPYLIERCTTSDGLKVLLEAKDAETLTEVSEKKVMRELKNYLAAVADSYGFPDGTYAKTGTAETGNYADSTITWIVCANNRYTVCIRSKNNKTGSSLKEMAKNILAFLNTEYQP